MGYRLRVIGLALLGYAYLFGLLGFFTWPVVSCLVAALRGTVTAEAAQAAFGGLFVIYLIVPTLLKIRVPEPEGIELSREEAPRLFALIDETGRALGSPKIDHVVVGEDLNAGVRQVPRFGPFGRPVNYLLLGMPLLDALSPEQFRAVLLHEFGHLAGSHGRLGAWIYRLRGTWNALSQSLDAMETDTFGWLNRVFVRWLVQSFFRWYAPRFKSRSLQLARRQELEADRRAAELAGRDGLATSLLRTEVAGRYLDEEFWPELDRLVCASPEPPATAFALLRHRLCAPATLGGKLNLWSKEAVGAAADPENTHPPLSKRLQAIGWADSPAAAAGPAGEPASDTLLGDAAARLREEFGRRWAERKRAEWRKRHISAQARLAKVESLREKASRTALEPQEAWTLYSETKSLRGTAIALPLLKELLARSPNDARVAFEAGAYLLTQADERGPAWLERAVSLDPHLIPAACSRLKLYRARRGEALEEGFRRRLGDYERRLNAAERERWSAGGSWKPHEVTAAQLRRLQLQLESAPWVRRAYLARKEVASFPEQPYHVLAVVPGSFHSPAAVEKLAVELPFEGEVRVLRAWNQVQRARFALLRAGVFSRPRTRLQKALLWALGLFAAWMLTSLIVALFGT